jgi:phenylacetic acid degradation protein
MTTMTVFSFEGIVPVVHESSFVHPNATVTGDVVIGRDVYVGPGAAIRGDWGRVVIEDGCNVQENCVIHMFPGVTVVLEAGAHVGHGAVVHGARIGRNTLIGMNAVIMDNAFVGAECIVGALTFVPADMQIPGATSRRRQPGQDRTRCDRRHAPLEDRKARGSISRCRRDSRRR